jgi:glycosyltransferase involved in cell wall biosynthesis
MISNVNCAAARSALSGQPFMTDPQHTISVALCTYNGGDFFAPQLVSVTRQSRLPEEIIICDDGSTDGTAELSSLLGEVYEELRKSHFVMQR